MKRYHPDNSRPPPVFRRLDNVGIFFKKNNLKNINMELLQSGDSRNGTAIYVAKIVYNGDNVIDSIDLEEGKIGRAKRRFQDLVLLLSEGDFISVESRYPKYVPPYIESYQAA